MSLYKSVWAPDGTMFEVPPEKASDLVLNKGWSNTPPQAEKKAKKKAKPAAKDIAPVADTMEDSVIETTFGQIDTATSE